MLEVNINVINSTSFQKMFIKAKQSRINNFQTKNTVKLGYNELGYNEHSVITNIFFSPKWSVYCINQHGYNETRL